jgi:hypothetical protein
MILSPRAARRHAAGFVAGYHREDQLKRLVPDTLLFVRVVVRSFIEHLSVPPVGECYKIAILYI